MINIDLKHCTACGACAQKCPCGAIALTENKDGFLFPKIDSKCCVNCGKCESVCPINKELTCGKPTAYAAVNTNLSELMQETSGGVFGAIANYILINGGVVYGCGFSDELQAEHIRLTSSDKLNCLYGSKYVQSNTMNTFSEVKTDLKNGKTVLYTGTPCQIAGLKTFLEHDYQNLITVDLICHGVPSQAFFNKFISGIEIKENAKLKSLCFRSKQTKGCSYSGKYVFLKNETIEEKPFYYFEHYYYWYFLKGATYRESCYRCKYANTNRQGDFTLGDFWGAEKYNLGFKTNKGCSLVLLNTEKSKTLFKKLKLKSQSVALEDAVKNNAQLQSPSSRPIIRDDIIGQFRKLSAEEMQSQFELRYKHQILVARIKYAIPEPIRNILQKIRFKIK